MRDLSNIKAGFTLAEVLITLGIIGVVAAMTMPTLMNQTNGAQYKAAYKKALSAISQAITLNVALDDISFADTTASSTNTTVANSIAGVLASRMNVVKSTTSNSDGKSNITLYFNDGSAFEFEQSATGCTFGQAGVKNVICKGMLDVNGDKGPNKTVSCSSGDNSDACVVDNATDRYPVRFYDQTILPNSYAARAVLYGK